MLIHQFQPQDSSLCGQTCVAMIASISISQSIDIFKKRGRTNTKNVVNALRYLGFHCSDKAIRISKDVILPLRCIARVRECNNKRWSHWIVLWDGWIYDPAYGLAELPHNPNWSPSTHMTSFIPVEPLH